MSNISNISNIFKFRGAALFGVEVSSSTLNGAFPMHSHEYTELNIFVGGRGTHIVCGREYLVGPGDVFVINPDAVHGFSNTKDLFHYKVNYMESSLNVIGKGLRQFSGYQALFVLAASGGNKGFPCRLKLAAPDIQWLVALIKRLGSELKRQEPGCETLSQAYFMEIVVGLARCYGRKIDAQNDLSHIDKMAILASHLERHCTENISCEEMARIACLSERQLRRVFADYYQTNPIDYLLHLRLKHAAELIVSTNQTITEIAYVCGFNDSSYFCRQFRKKMGMSPRDYRTQLANAVLI